MRKGSGTSFEFLGVEVVGMGVRDEQIFDQVALNTVVQKMKIGIGGQIDQKIAVDERLRFVIFISKGERKILSPCTLEFVVYDFL